MKRILNKLFSKLVLGGLIIILQFSWFVYLLYSATVYSSMVDALFKIASIVLALFVSSRDMRSTYKTSWIFLILALPLFGIPAYYLFGRPGLTKRTRMKMDVVSSRIRAYSSPSDDVMSALRAEDDSAGQQAQYLTRYAGYPVYREADTQYYCCGEEMYPQFLEDLKTAKSYIFLEYFIAEPGKMLDAIVEILAQKVKEGVDVRFMYDGIGCIQTLPNKYYCYLQEKGIKCACFQPFRPLMSIIQNNRDHRKITVIDGKVAYTGGMNLADEYINA
ncbi:MAG: phospholipase D-like domain-containing protein, partial [Lachnospiraceae bacterium]|nr:phospholipase D-like domain-containing protein [Lachnospiraceae bacterium]